MQYTMRYQLDQQHTRLPHRTVHKNAARSKPRQSTSQPFDPNELTRRLYVVLAEQKAHSEKKRASRAASNKIKYYEPEQEPPREAAPKQTPHQSQASSSLAVKKSRSILRLRSRPKTIKTSHVQDKEKIQEITPKAPSDISSKGQDEEVFAAPYVPQVAASQFSLTTTVDAPPDRELVHRLSRQAVKFHKDGLQASRELASTAKTGTAPFEQHQALQRAQSMRERLYERNQFQHTSTLPTTVEVNESKARHKQHHRLSLQPQSIEAHVKANIGGHKAKSSIRRMSTGSMLGKIETAICHPECPNTLVPVKTETCELCELAPINTNEHRVDWTQSDELVTAPKDPAPASQLRKLDSIWTLRGRLGSFSKHGKDERGSSPTDVKDAVEESPKSPKSGF